MVDGVAKDRYSPAIIVVIPMNAFKFTILVCINNFQSPTFEAEYI